MGAPSAPYCHVFEIGRKDNGRPYLHCTWDRDQADTYAAGLIEHGVSFRYMKAKLLQPNDFYFKNHYPK